MKKIVLDRRQVLRGSGGFALGLPFLPSLVPGRAWGQAVTPARRPFFVAITTQHGGVFENSFYPPDAALTEQKDLYPGHVIRRGTLTARREGVDAVLSPVLRAPATALTDRLVSKISILRGLDIPLGIAHHTGGYLGNYARNDANESDGQKISSQHMPTIDQLMAWSPKFYPNLNGIRERSMVADLIHARVSWGFSSPSTRTGTIQGIETTNSPGDLFRKVFVPPTSGTTPPPPVMRKRISDRVLANYRSLREGNRRLSPTDRQRLDDHIDRLNELDRKLNVTAPGAGGGVPSTSGCGGAKAPANANGVAATAAAFIDVYAAAFACGSSRLGVLGIHDPGFANDDDVHYHQQVAHRAAAADAQPILATTNRRQFSEIFVRLAANLDAIEVAPGNTLLDDSLVMWINESGPETHNPRSLPLVIAGRAAGQIKSGQYIDYRNRTSRVNGGPSGLMYNQWLATALQLMGLPPADWQGIANNGTTGYGHSYINSSYAASHVAGVKSNASQILPYLAA